MILYSRNLGHGDWLYLVEYVSYQAGFMREGSSRILISAGTIARLKITSDRVQDSVLAIPLNQKDAGSYVYSSAHFADGDGSEQRSQLDFFFFPQLSFLCVVVHPASSPSFLPISPFHHLFLCYHNSINLQYKLQS